MNSFWVNYGEYIVGIPALIISTLLAFWLFIKQKNKKSLEYKITINENLLSYHSSLKDRLTINFEDQKIENLIFFSIEFQNTGNIPILKNDYESSITLRFKNINSIMSSNIVHKTPNNLDLKLIKSQEFIEISPLLLNPRDKFLVSSLLDAKIKNIEFEIHSRIAGVQKIEQVKQRMNILTIYTILLSALFIIFILFLAIFFFYKGNFVGGFMSLSLLVILYYSYYQLKDLIFLKN